MKFITLLIILFSVVTVKAQTENNSERLITQLKNGTAPGLLFDRSAPAKKTVDNTEQKESLISQIRKGIAPGMKFMTGAAATARSVSPNTSGAKTAPLASEMEIQKETLKTNIAPPIIPNQEEVKKEAEKGKQ